MKLDLRLRRRIWLVLNPGIVSKLSKQTGLSVSMVYQVLYGDRRSEVLSAALAEAGAPGFKKTVRRHQRQTPMDTTKQQDMPSS